MLPPAIGEQGAKTSSSIDLSWSVQHRKVQSLVCSVHRMPVEASSSYSLPGFDMPKHASAQVHMVQPQTPSAPYRGTAKWQRASFPEKSSQFT